MNDLVIEPTFKIIIIGNSGVGKTSILQRYLLNKFYENTIATIGLVSTEKEIILKDGKKIKLKLFDTQLQDKKNIILYQEHILEMLMVYYLYIQLMI